MKYNEEQTKAIIEAYQKAENKKAIVEKLAIQFNVSTRSIIGKLAREQVYERTPYLNKLGQPPETKKQIIAEMAGLLNIDPEKIQGLEKAPKLELILIRRKITEKFGEVDET